MIQNNRGIGHRDRLRKKFLLDPNYLTQVEKVELLLTYAIPRVDVKPIANELLDRFETLSRITRKSVAELEEIPGIGPSAAVFLTFIGKLLDDMEGQKEDMNQMQPALFSLPEDDQTGEEKKITLFVNDEIKNSLAILSQAYDQSSKESFEQFLVNNLPYNAKSTRIRRARYILSRYLNYPDIKNPLTILFNKSDIEAARKNALFYTILKQEKIAAYFAEEVIWPNLALGFVSKSQIEEFVKRYFPESKEKTIYEVQKALLNTYKLLDVGQQEGEKVFFSLRNGDMESFLFVLISEYPQPETVPFEKLLSGFMHRHMLWHRDWIQKQLYRLRELKIISKISEIDFVKQFTLDVDQKTALEIYYQSIIHQDRGGHETQSN
ncbi:MAG: DUF1819 family protein [Anaerolineaceae bacterium]|nr:DUF1819 family protein [Anaerolineaceae bacterium]